MVRHVGTVTHPYEQIAAALRAAILSGELVPGATIPSANKLADDYGTTRNTARKAIDVLLDEGLIDIRQGARATVRPQQVVRVWGDTDDWQRHRGAGLPGFNATVADHGLTPRQEILDVQDPVPAPPHIAASLGLDDGAPVVVRSVLQLADGEPLRLVHMHFPASWASGTALAGRARIRGGVAGYIQDPDGPIARRLTDSDVELESRTPTLTERELLRLPRGVTVMDVMRIFYDDEGRAVFAQREVAHGRRHRYRFRVPL